MSKQLKLAYYLPQFHEVEENNKWWGQGFTEWTHINNSNQYFDKHKIRKPIAPLGEYNLLDLNILEQQYELASKYNIDGFIVWNYWFGNNKKILEKPIEQILEHPIRFKFCFAWANHSWMNKSKGILLKEQKYLGEKDYIEYFQYLLPYFLNENYIQIDGKPVFTIFRPQDVPDLSVFIEAFTNLAIENGFSGIYFIAENTKENANYLDLFDGFCNSACYLQNRYKTNPISFLKEKLSQKLKIKNLGPFVYSYDLLTQNFAVEENKKYLPTVFTGWDTSIRHTERGLILKNFDLNSFSNHLKKIKSEYPKTDIVIIKSWNEWAEGNVLEPDSIFGYELLNEFKDF